MNALSLVLFGLFALGASGAPADESSTIPIVAYTVDGPNPDGSYHYSYETGNGISVQEQGQLKKSDSPDKEDAISVQGAFSYRAVDGSPISLSYVADENGFQPKGDHLPTPPPIPAGIIKALEYIAAHPEEDNQTK